MQSAQRMKVAQQATKIKNAEVAALRSEVRALQARLQVVDAEASIERAASGEAGVDPNVELTEAIKEVEAAAGLLGESLESDEIEAAGEKLDAERAARGGYAMSSNKRAAGNRAATLLSKAIRAQGGAPVPANDVTVDGEAVLNDAGSSFGEDEFGADLI